MNACRSHRVLAIAFAAMFGAIARSPARAAIITLTGGDAADASDGIGYAPAVTPIYAYRIITTSPMNGQSIDQSAYIYNGVTFQPFSLAGNVANQNSAVSTTGSVTLNNGFFYPQGATSNIGSGGGSLSSDDTTLFNIAKYQSFSTSGNYFNNHGTQTLTLGGLRPGGLYQVDVFSASFSTGIEYLYTFAGAGGALPTDNVIPTDARAAGVVYDVRHSVVANGSGQITVAATDNLAHNDNATINAFSVTQAPEPASAALLVISAVAMISRARKRV